MKEYLLLSFSSLFVILDPVAVLPAFLGMTSHSSPQARARTARLACIVAAAVLLLFTFIGEWIFRLMGISMPAFQLAGSIVLLKVALDMLNARVSAVRETPAETSAGAEKEDIAITPLAVPMLAGPGALSTALMLKGQAKTWMQDMTLYAVIIVSCALCYFVFRLASHGAKWFSPIAMKVTTRIMGLLLAALSIQFMLNSLRTLGVLS